MSIWFTSDLHFNHARIIELCKRPFKSVEEMNQSLIDKWNAVVGTYDEVFVLGDFAFWYKDAQPLDEIFHSLKGNKHLIIGNHDEQNKKVLQLPWDTQRHIGHVRWGEASRFVLCHYPFERWWHMERGTIHLHGHCHGSAPEANRRFDVGVDSNSFAPVHATTLISIALQLPFSAEAYHIK